LADFDPRRHASGGSGLQPVGVAGTAAASGSDPASATGRPGVTAAATTAIFAIGAGLGVTALSIEAMMACIGIRPLAISRPPARRAADAKGAAQVSSLLARHCDAQALLGRDQVLGVFRVLGEIDLHPLDRAGEDAAVTVVVVADR